MLGLEHEGSERLRRPLPRPACTIIRKSSTHKSDRRLSSGDFIARALIVLPASLFLVVNSIFLFFALFVLCFFVCVCFSVSFFPSLQFCPPTHCRCGGLLWPCSLSKMHSHTVRLLWTRDRPVAEASTCTGHKTRNRQTSMSRRD